MPTVYVGRVVDPKAQGYGFIISGGVRIYYNCADLRLYLGQQDATWASSRESHPQPRPENLAEGTLVVFEVKNEEGRLRASPLTTRAQYVSAGGRRPTLQQLSKAVLRQYLQPSAERAPRPISSAPSHRDPSRRNGSGAYGRFGRRR